MSIGEFLNKVSEAIVNPLIRLMFAAATIVFAWGIVQFISSAQSDEKREEGKRTMLWGIIGMFIMISVYGIVAALLGTFGIDSDYF
ncbi:MAG: hypothetical protein U1D31_01255 [Patescibacteria group bacterium]|nr:hypothetical protein [bacterium]MDZ4240743.1 hypothetical protein [Patescibacteria group bacterium]